MTDLTKPRLRVGLLGCGVFARRYHVPALQDPGGQGYVSAICDVQPNDEIRAVARAAGVPVLHSIAELLEPNVCEAVIISTPHALHFPHAREVLAAGRHALVDKPFVLELQHAHELERLGRERGLTCAVAFNRRLDPACLRARDLIATGAIGPVRCVEAIQLGYLRVGWFNDPVMSGGGPFTGRGAHMADILPWLLAKKPARLRARLQPGEAGGVDRGGQIDLDFGTFEARITCIDEGLPLWDEVRIFGDRGFLELRRPLGSLIGWTLAFYAAAGEEKERVSADPTPGAVTADFVRAVLNKAEPACDFADAALSVNIIECAFASAANGEKWLDLV